MVSRRKFLSQVAASSSLITLASMLSPRIAYGQAMGDGRIRHIILPFLRGGQDPLASFPILSGPAKSILETKRPNIYPRDSSSDANLVWANHHLLHTTQSGNVRVFHPNFADLKLARSELSNGFGVHLVRGVGNTFLQKISLSHQIAQDQYSVGSGESPSSYAQGWLARLADAASMRTGKIYGVSVPSRLDFLVSNPENAPIVVSALRNYSRWQSSTGAFSSSFTCSSCTGTDKVVSAADDRAFENQILEQLANGSSGGGELNQQFNKVIQSMNPTFDQIAQIKAWLPAGFTEPTFEQLFRRRFFSNGAWNVASSLENEWQQIARDLVRLVGYNNENFTSGTFIYTCDLGGWDHHNGIVYNMSDRVKWFSAFLSGLMRGLSSSGTLGKTVVATASEFGRTVKENGSAGTDHGSAAAMLILGGITRHDISGDPESDLVTELQSDKNYVTPVVPFTSIFKTILREGGFTNDHLRAAFPFAMPNESTLPLFI